MRKAIKYLLATAGMFVLGYFAMTVAQNIENGVGVVCESPQQVEQVIILRTDFKSAVAEINAQNSSRVCEILNVAFLVGGIVAEASNDKGTWQMHPGRPTRPLRDRAFDPQERGTSESARLLAAPYRLPARDIAVSEFSVWHS
jgi:hypothetical protein